MASVILIQAWPRNASTGAEVALRFAGGGSRAYNQLGFLDWRAGVVAMPRYSSAIAFEQVGFTGGAIPTTGAIAFNSSDQTLSSTVGNYLWTDARVEITVGDDETGVYATAAKGKVAGASCDGGVLSITFADMSGDLTKMVVPDTFAGTGGVEGPAEATGRIKRRSWGRVFDVEARLINVAQNIYEVGDPSKPLQQIEIVRDKGRNGPLSVLAWQGSITATYNALVAASVPAGGAVVAPSIAMLKWWTVPSGPLTADLRGEVGAGYVETVATIANRLVGTFSTAITVGNLAEASGWSSAPAGIHAADQTESVGKLLDRLLAPMLWAWTISPAAVLTFSRLSFSAPVEVLSAITISRNGTFAPLKQRIVGYKKNHRVHGDGEISSALLASDVIYEDGQTVQDLQPAEAGATNGASAAEKSQLTQLEIDTANAQANIADAQAQIAAIEGSVSADFSAVNAEVDALQGSLSTAQTNIAALQSGQSTLSTQVGNLQTQAASIAASVSGLNTQVGTINTNVSALTTRIADAEGDIDSLQSTVASQGAAITANALAITNAQGSLADYSLRLSSNSRNLLANGGPEALLRGWTGSALWTVNANNSEGSYFLFTPTATGTFVLTSDAIPMEAGVALTLGYETRNTGATSYCDIQCYDASATLLLDGGQNAGPSGTNWGDRANRAFTVTTPANTASVRVRLVCVVTATSDRGRIRQVKLDRGSNWTAYSNEASVAQSFTAISSAEANVASLQTTVSTQGASITSLQTATSTNTGNIASLTTRVGTAESSITSLQSASTTQAGQISTLQSTVATQGSSISSNATAITTLQGTVATLTTRVVASSPNLLPNGGLENGFNSGIASTSTYGFSNGTWGPTATSTTSGSSQIFVFSQVAVSAGQVYTLSCDPLAAGAGSTVYCDMLFRDASSNILLDSAQNALTGAFDFDPTSGRRGQIAITATAPAGTTNVVCRFVGVAASGGAVGFRQMKLERSSTWSPYSADASIVQTFTAYSGLNSSLASLTTTVSTQGGSITTLQSSFTSLNGTVSSLSSTVSAQGTSISTLQTTTSTHTGQIAQHTTDIATANSNISTNAQAISTANGNIASLTTTVNTQGATISSQATAISTLQGQQSSLSSTVSAQGASITTLQTATSTLEGNVATLTTRVGARGNNLLPNGGLENGFASGIASSSTYAFSNGTWGPTATTTTTGTQVLQFSPVAVSAGQTYTLACDPVAAGAGSTVYCDMLFRDASGATLLDTGQNVQTGAFDFDQTTARRGMIAITATAPTNTASVVCRFVGNAVSGGTVGFRQMKLERGSTWSPYSAEASITQSFSTLSTLTTQYASLSSTVSTQGVTISSQATAITTIQGNVTTLFGRAALTLNVNGAISGYEINNNGTVSNFKILASQFQVVDPDGNGSVPFEVSGGVTRIKAAAIGDATIDTLKIANGAITSLSYNSGITTVTTGYTDVATVTVTPVAGSSVLKIEIAGVFQTGLGSTGGTQAGYIRVTRSDSTIDVIAEFRPVTGSGMAANFSYFAIITGVTSAITFKLQGKNALVTPAPPTGEPSTVRGTLAVTEYKK